MKMLFFLFIISIFDLLLSLNLSEAHVAYKYKPPPQNELNTYSDNNNI